MKRLSILSLFVFGLFSLLIMQFYKIQIVEGKKWGEAARRQHHLSVVEPCRRGLFYANATVKKGHPEENKSLVVDVPKYHLYADPEAIPDTLRGDVAQNITRILRLGSTEKTKLTTQLAKKSRSRKLVLWLSRQNYEALQAWWQPFAKSSKLPRNALFFVQDYKRSYPYGKMLGQVLHALREDKDPVTHQSIPTGGLELAFDSYLKGKEGRRIILRSPRHPLDTGEVIQAPEHGADVFLTINPYLQAIAEEEIEKATKNANAGRGWAIIMEPKTGEIWALAQYPFFEPASYRKYFSNPLLLNDTKVCAITDPYEPGSTFKPLTLIVALKANEELKRRGKPPLFSVQEKVPVSVGHFPGRGKPLKDLRLHYFLNMYMGLQKSSNIYMATMMRRVVEQLGETWYRNTLHDVFGMGEKTGIELPGESSGLLPMPGKKHPSGAPEWSKATPPSLAMGHNILVNSMQMVRAYGILANGGYDVKPTLIRKIVKDQKILKEHILPEPRRMIEPEMLREVVKAMRFVTQEGGSASRANIPGYTEAGKTGTTEKIVNGIYSKKDHISTFVGFAPAVNPQFVLLVAIDDPKFQYIPGVGRNQRAGTCSAPGFRDIGLRVLQYLGVPPDDPENKVWKKEVGELKELYQKWNGGK